MLTSDLRFESCLLPRPLSGAPKFLRLGLLAHWTQHVVGKWEKVWICSWVPLRFNILEHKHRQDVAWTTTHVGHVCMEMHVLLEHKLVRNS